MHTASTCVTAISIPSFFRPSNIRHPVERASSFPFARNKLTKVVANNTESLLENRGTRSRLPLTTEMFSFSSSLFLLFLVFFVRGVRLGEASFPATPSIFFFFVFVPTFVPGDVTVVLVVIVSSRLSLCARKYIFWLFHCLVSPKLLV